MNDKKASNKSKKNCKHPAKAQVLVVIDAFCGCETTRIQCSVCGTYITAPKTDC